MLHVENLTLRSHQASGIAGGGAEAVLENISFTVEEGHTTGLVGERGSGKLALFLALLRLEPVAEGKVIFFGQDLLALPGGAFLEARRRMQPLFSPDFGALPPRQPLHRVLEMTLRAHFAKLSDAQRRHRIDEALQLSGLPFSLRKSAAEDLSRGEIQQAVLARALLAQPRLLLALDFTKGLDAAVQASLLNRLKDLQEAFRLGLLIATPDLAAAAFMSDSLHILHRGRIVESGPAEELVATPSHDYTQKLISAALTLH